MADHRLLKSLTLAALLMLPLPTLAHGSVKVDDDLCAIQIGYLRAHFKIYLPRERQHRDYCEDLPGQGEALFVMDYIHRDLGRIPIEFRIIRNVTGMGRFARLEHVEAIANLDEVTEFHRPPALAPDVFSVLHRFDESGEFIGIVTAMPGNGSKPYSAVFPFQVGFTGFGYWPLIVLLLLALQLNYLYMGRRFPFHRRRRLRPVSVASS